MRINFTIEALDNLSVSQSHAGSFSDNSLDYIPGSALLGVFASKLYPKLSAENAWRAFQNGDVKFSNCYPLFKNDSGYFERVLPVPFSLHYAKQSGSYEQSLKVRKVFNCYPSTTNQKVHKEHNDHNDQKEQLKQLRSGYIRFNGTRASDIKTGTAVKTAIDFETQSASDGKLFVTGFIKKGTLFGGFIDGDDELISNIVKVIKESEGIFRVGKSRGSEYGRVKLVINDSLSQQQDLINNNGKTLVLWCISDIVFYDTDMGMPSAVPLASNLLWNKQVCGKYLYKNSFIRKDSLRFFNRMRGGYDGEKILVKKGSIISFLLDEPLTDSDLKEISQNGIGIDRQMGFGQVIVNPKWLTDVDVFGCSDSVNLFSPYKIPVKDLKNETAIPEFDEDLYIWFKSKKDSEKKKKTAQKSANEINQKVYKMYELARKYNNVSEKNVCGPSSSQLHRILTLLKREITNEMNSQKLSDEILKKIKNICDPKTDSQGWGIIASFDTDKYTSFGEYYVELIKNYSYLAVLMHLESLAQDDPSQWNVLKKNISLGS